MGTSKIAQQASFANQQQSMTTGVIKDFITGKLLRITREEVVRQKIEHMLVEEYGYSKNQMDIEFNIQRGSLKGKRSEKADIVIFNDEKKKSQIDIYAVIETESPEKDFDNQLISYVTATPATFCIWANGKKTLFFHRPLKQPTLFEPIDQIPRKGESISDIGKHLKSQLQPATSLRMIFENIHNNLYGSANVRRPEKLGSEMTKLYYSVSIYDEKTPEQKCEFRATIDEMSTDHGKELIAKRINGLFTNVKKQYNDVFGNTEEIILDNDSIALVVSKLQYIGLMKTDSDTVGEAFEVFVPNELKGTKGELFTPRPSRKYGNRHDKDRIL